MKYINNIDFVDLNYLLVDINIFCHSQKGKSFYNLIFKILTLIFYNIKKNSVLEEIILILKIPRFLAICIIILNNNANFIFTAC